MTHVYSAGGSRQAAVLTAIIGLHCAVLLVVLNDRIPAFRETTSEPGPINLLLPKPDRPVIERPDNVVLVEPFGQGVEEPDIPIPEFTRDNAEADASTDGKARDGGLPSSGRPTVRTQASLQGLSRDFAAVVRACYPAGARREGAEGLLKLALTIGADGQARSWRIADSTGFPRLDAAAQCVLDKLRFNAAREDGRAIQSETVLPILFRLN